MTCDDCIHKPVCYRTDSVSPSYADKCGDFTFEKTGHWIDIGSESFEFYRVYKCSECGNTEIEYPERICEHFRYCPNCGCKMESEDKKCTKAQ